MISSVKKETMNNHHSRGFNQKYRIFKIIVFFLLILTLLFIWSNSTRTSIESNGHSDCLIDWLKPIIDPNNRIGYKKISFLIRKTAHFCEYALLGAGLALLAFFSRKKSFFTPFLFILLCAAIDETIQLFHNRTSSVKDVFLDFFGGIFGFFFIILLFNIIKYISKRRKFRDECIIAPKKK